MKKYNILICVLISAIISLSTFGLGYLSANSKNHKIIITEITVNDGVDKGTISVLFTDNGREYGLEFITYKELNELLNQ